MDEKTRNQISDEYEDHVREWFEASGFVGEKLDTGSGKQGESADWRFTKHDLVVICEVKTIFSSSQSGLTEDQYERRWREYKRKFDYTKELADAEGHKLITTQDELDYVEGKVPYRKPQIRKEQEFNNFQAAVRAELTADKNINQLPFSVTLMIDGMYVAYRKELEQFIEWLTDFVLQAHTNPNSEHRHTGKYTFIPYRKAKDGTIQREINAYVILESKTYPQLNVDFLESGGVYNEGGIAAAITRAISQLQASMSRENNPDALPAIALWSASNLNFSMLLAEDIIGAQLHEPPERFYLFDWAFSDYPKLAAIILFRLHRDGDFWNPLPTDRLFPAGWVITNPNLPQAEKTLKAAITENVTFTTGLASNPLDEPIKYEYEPPRGSVDVD